MREYGKPARRQGGAIVSYYRTALTDTAEEAINILADLIAKHGDDPFVTSAAVCLNDAESLIDQGAFAFAVRRAHKGISYLSGFHANDWRAIA
jgi:hypothetical protein